MNYISKLSQKQIRMLIFGIVIIISAIIFAEIVTEIFVESKSGDVEAVVFDKAVLKTLQGIRNNFFNESMLDITALGSFSVIALLSCVIILFLIVHKDWRGLCYITLLSIGSLKIPVFFKNYYMRERPDILGRLAIVKSASFPSGHSFAATVAYCSLAFLLARELKNIKLEILYYLLAFFVIGLVGTSRMYLGVHYPTDVVGGVSLALIWFSLVSMGFVYFAKESDAK